MIVPVPNYTVDDSHWELREEQIYWNANDGEMLLIIEVQDNEVTVASLTDGSVELWSREGTIFNDECVGSELIPVKFTGFNHVQE